MIFNMVGGGGSENGGGNPVFSFTGNSSPVIDDSVYSGVEGDWKIELYTTGTLSFSKLGKGKGSIDVFIVGGGAGGHDNGGGGGGGYTALGYKSIVENTDYPIVIGAGGSKGSNGGTSSAFGVSAEGGKVSSNGYNGGNGGSGGSCSTRTNSGYNGAQDGANGSGSPYAGGTGMGTYSATGVYYCREFREAGGILYGSGGGGGYVNGVGSGRGNGGAGAGGKNGDALPNRGGGGGSGNYVGGSGIVIIRNHRG